MARPQKPLEEQLKTAESELKKYEGKVVQCKQAIVTIKNQIEDRDMRKSYALLKQNNISVAQLEKMLSKSKDENRKK